MRSYASSSVWIIVLKSSAVQAANESFQSTPGVRTVNFAYTVISVGSTRRICIILSISVSVINSGWSTITSDRCFEMPKLSNSSFEIPFTMQMSATLSRIFSFNDTNVCSSYGLVNKLLPSFFKWWRFDVTTCQIPAKSNVISPNDINATCRRCAASMKILNSLAAWTGLPKKYSSSSSA